MDFNPKLPGDTHLETEALEQIDTLRSTLDYIRSIYRSGDVTQATGRALSAMAALREELVDSIASSQGYRLMNAAARLEGEKIEAGGGDVFPLNAAQCRDNQEDPDAYFRDCRVLARAWNSSWSVEQLQEKLSASEAATECGAMTARALVTHYDRVKELLHSQWE